MRENRGSEDKDRDRRHRVSEQRVSEDKDGEDRRRGGERTVKVRTE